jgi:Protein of unknown function (DUF732)
LTICRFEPGRGHNGHKDAHRSPLWDDLGIMRLLLTLSSLAVVIGIAAPAHADAVDDQFLATVKAAGITFPDPGKAISAGRFVCNTLGQGSPMADVVKTVENANPAITEENAAKFTAIAANVYCPKTLAGNSHAVPGE